MNIIFYNMSCYYDWEAGIVNRNRMIFDTICKNKDEYGVKNIISVDLLPFNTRKAIKCYVKGKLYKRYKNTISKSPIYRIDKLKQEIYHFSGLSDVALPHLLEHLGITDDNLCVFAYDPVTIHYLSRYPRAKLIFETVDNWSTNPVFVKIKDKILQNYEEIAKKVDVIFTVAPSLLNLYPKHKNKHWIPNGVNLDALQTLQDSTKIMDKLRIRGDKKIIGYVGTIEKRVDFELLEYLLEKNADKFFVIAGPVRKEVQERVNALDIRFNNVIFPGRILYDDLYSFLNVCDICIMPHKVDDFTKSMNPMKLFDYLVVGKPVVCTPSSQLEIFENELNIAHDYYSFHSLMNEALQNNSEYKQEKRKKFIKKHTWKSRVDTMFNKIKI